MNHHAKGRWLVWLSFLVAFILEIIPWPEQYYMFRPSWVLLILFYWLLALPRQVNVGTSFLTGIIMDLITGSTLGIRALVFSIVAYSIIYRYQLFRNLALWQQAGVVFLLSLSVNLMVFWTRFLISDINFRPELLYSAVIDGILWPWLFLFLKKLRHQYSG